MFDDPAVGEVQDPFEPGEIAAGGKDVVVRGEAVGQGADGDPSGIDVYKRQVLGGGFETLAEDSWRRRSGRPPGALQAMEAAAEVDQAVALFEDLDVLQLQQQHRMGADLLDLGDASLQVGQGAVQHRQPGEALAPVVEGEAALHRDLGHAGEVAGHLFVFAAEDVHAESTVGLEHRVHLAVAVLSLIHI